MKRRRGGPGALTPSVPWAKLSCTAAKGRGDTSCVRLCPSAQVGVGAAWSLGWTTQWAIFSVVDQHLSLWRKVGVSDTP